MADSPRRLVGRIALITGASRGIGAAVARRFAAEGAQVLLAARTVGGLEEVDDAIRTASAEQTQATLIPIDLKNVEDVEKLKAAVAARFGKLDVLVGNAAILGDMTPVSQIDPKTWDDVIETNLTANWHLIRTLEPLLLSSDSGRAIFVTSGVSGGRAYWGGYAVSKTALEALVQTWAQEVEQTKLRINIVNPGAVRTSMRAKAYPGEDPMTLPPPKDVTDIFVDLASEQCDRHGDVVSAQ
jgi:NAD(P)-dependent dehydrogenase (short-subunit alcohol dehydrogenase family)